MAGYLTLTEFQIHFLGTPSMSVEAQALELLGQNHSQEIVAAACGVTPSRISQLMSDPEFAKKVRELRFAYLRESSELDAKYNKLELDLVTKLERTLPMMFKAGEILNAIRVINGTKRRGVQGTGLDDTPQTIVQLTLPAVIVNKFTMNIMNQIIEVKNDEGQCQSLVTLQSEALPKLAIQASQEAASIRAEEQESRRVTLARLGQGRSSKTAAKVQITVDDI